ncbi:MAG: ribonuclease R [Pseudomonadota bacterium]
MTKKTKKTAKRENVLPKDILDVMQAAGRPLFARDVLNLLDVSPQYRRPAKDLIAQMVQGGELIPIKGGRLGLPQSMNLVTGRIQANPAGFAFLIPEESDKDDVYIPGREMKGAVHGDRVVVRLEHGLRSRRPEGRVVRILERKTRHVIGTFGRGPKISYVVPEDDRLAFEVIIPSEGPVDVREGDIVLAEITNFPPDRRNPEGKILEVLGDPESLLVQTQIVIHKHGLTQDFGPEAEEQAGQLPAEIDSQEIKKREDLRGLPTMTIDGEQARDFDDAVSIQKDRFGYKLYVSIADISHYVKPGCPLDQDAFKRGNSAYFPNHVLPMFPPALSDHLGSLKPETDRLAVTVLMRFDRKGVLRERSFFRSVIHSHARLTYTEVRGMLAEKNRPLRLKYRQFIRSLENMGELAEQLAERRRQRGSIDFDLPEPEIILGVQGTLEDIVRRERNVAHQIIEEFMIAANEAVASYFEELDVPALFRVHEEPEKEKVTNFLDFAYSLGLSIDFPEKMKPSWFQNVLGLVEGQSSEYIVNTLLLRSMKQAVYAPENLGHFGLASSVYTHFTSPIRRYADLIVHRILIHALHGKKKPLYTKAQLSEMARHLCVQERLAMEAEREIVDRLRVQFMSDKIGEEYDGIISSVTSFGFFVELKEIFVEGVVRLADMADDYYYYEEEHHRLVGRRKRKIFQIGDFVRVQVVKVDVPRRHVNFVLVMKYTSRAPE